MSTRIITSQRQVVRPVPRLGWLTISGPVIGVDHLPWLSRHPVSDPGLYPTDIGRALGTNSLISTFQAILASPAPGDDDCLLWAFHTEW